MRSQVHEAARQRPSATMHERCCPLRVLLHIIPDESTSHARRRFAGALRCADTAVLAIWLQRSASARPAHNTPHTWHSTLHVPHAVGGRACERARWPMPPVGEMCTPPNVALAPAAAAAAVMRRSPGDSRSGSGVEPAGSNCC